MKRIYINHTKRAISFDGIMLLPGSNVTEELDEKKFPTLTALIDDGDVEVTNDPENAIRKANTQQIVEDIAKMAPKNKKVKKAAGKRKAALDGIDEQAKNAIKKQTKKDSADDEGEEENEEEA